MKIRFKAYDEIVNLSKLKPSEYQRNKHPQEQIERLAMIMKEEGVHHAIHVSRRSGNVCFGHGRWDAALLNGWTEFPVTYNDFDSDDHEYRVVQSDNALGKWSDLDFAAINADIASGKVGPFNVALLGIDGFVVDMGEKDTVGGSKEEWDGMPEFDQKDKTAHQTVQLHLFSQEAVNEFAKLIGQPITDKTRTIWYPAQPIEKASDKRYGES